MKHFGARLRELRGDAGWRQQDLAARLDVSRPTIANLETGRQQPSGAVWAKLEEALPRWYATLQSNAKPSSESPAAPILGGPFVVESLSLIYVFEEHLSPSEIIEVRRVRATLTGVSSYGLSLRQTASPGFKVDEQVLFGGHIESVEYIDEPGSTQYLRRFRFDRSLSRGQSHEFAVRSWVERDPEPGTEINFQLTLPTQYATIHLKLPRKRIPHRIWQFGPAPETESRPTRPGHVAPKLLEVSPAGTVSARFDQPRQGPGRFYGVAWCWP